MKDVTIEVQVADEDLVHGIDDFAAALRARLEEVYVGPHDDPISVRVVRVIHNG